ncbi:CocE/NonD family hydrolase [Georgenia sp. AZ-5]|uniref:CocE/NonD family hydrolase n=1 Tax=Georgenia sp. AZ-5 TaxID=3367526 RepID=UPI0037549AC7
MSDLGGVRLDDDVAVRRQDGTTLRADIYRPSGRGRLPALVMRLPYDKRRAQSYWYAAPAWYAARGYAVVVEDVRGRHRSAGRFVPLSHEAQDGADLVAWVADQPWCDGAVGMYGYSYSGLLQLLTAGRLGDAAPLRAIVPALSPPGLGEGCLFRGGVPAAGFLLGWAAELGGLRLGPAQGPPLTRDLLRQLVLAPAEDLATCVPREAHDWMRHWLAGDPEETYWHSPAHRPAYTAIRAQALHLAGWYDTFRAGAVEHYQHLRAAEGRPSSADRLAVGPWTHQPVRRASLWPLAGPDPAAWQVDDLQVAFFDAMLRGGNDAGPPVRVAVLNSPDSWTGTAWPPESVPSEWHLASGGRANGRHGDGVLTPEGPRPGAPDHLVYDHADPVPTAGGDDCGDPDVVAMGPADQEGVEQRRDVLVYTSPQLGRDLVVLGEAEITFYFRTPDRTSQWLARLCLVTASGVSVNLAEAVARCTVPVHEPAVLRLAFGPVGFRVGSGERLRLHLTQGSSPRWAGLRDPDGRLAVSRSAVLHDPDHPSHLILPRVA